MSAIVIFGRVSEFVFLMSHQQLRSYGDGWGGGGGGGHGLEACPTDWRCQGLFLIENHIHLYVSKIR